MGGNKDGERIVGRLEIQFELEMTLNGWDVAEAAVKTAISEESQIERKLKGRRGFVFGIGGGNGALHARNLRGRAVGGLGKRSISPIADSLNKYQKVQIVPNVLTKGYQNYQKVPKNTQK